MEKFDVHLKDGRTISVMAAGYRREGDQYVFDKDNSNEVEFFLASEVVGINEALPNISFPKIIRT